MTTTSDRIRARLLAAGQRFRANDNIAAYIEPGEIDALTQEVAERVAAVLQSLVIDTENDHNTRETGLRVARMYVGEVFAGRYSPAPDLTAFPNVTSYDELYLVGPVTIRSTCAHHLQNIRGNCWIGIYPGKNVLGLSKFYRLTEWITARPQIQEEMTIQIADLVERETAAEGVAVVVKAEHMCVTHRGVREHASDMTTSVLRGILRDNPDTRAEFFRLLQGMKGSTRRDAPGRRRRASAPGGRARNRGHEQRAREGALLPVMPALAQAVRWSSACAACMLFTRAFPRTQRNVHAGRPRRVPHCPGARQCKPYCASSARQNSMRVPLGEMRR
jgi:GTP cyclohydrolase I